MEICVLGLNHKTAPLEIREKLSVPSYQTQNFLKILEERSIFEERLLLSTCNRTEIYGASSETGEAIGRAKQFLSELAHIQLSELEKKMYILRQPDSIEHLFSVASGLDSMVLGETEIIGQVKDAYFQAHGIHQTGKALNALFQRSFRVAKNLRHHTDIGIGRVSVASVAVDLAQKIFENLKGVRVMVLGTGQMASQVTKAMLAKGALSMIVSSCHYDRADTLARELGGEAVSYQTYETRIKDIDVVIASTLAPHALVHKEQVRSWMRSRHERPLFLIDIAMPRNIEEAVQKLDNVYLYNLDDLQWIANKNMAFRKGQLEECGKLVKHQTQHFMNWLSKEFGQ